MVDPGHVFRRAFSWLPSQFASQSDAPVGSPRQFGSTEHLSTEAIAAYVDGELRMKSYLRAAHHLSLCPQCAAEVDGQSQAREALRDSNPISTPTGLLGLLSQIPNSAPDECVPPPGRSRTGGDVERRSRPGGDVEPGLADQLADGAPRSRRKRR